MSVTDLLQKYSSQYGVPYELSYAVAYQESGLRQYDSSGGVLVSPAGALGVMQLMPGTAQGLGVNPNDIEQNVAGGVLYLRKKLDEFGGNVDSALAAYNAGSGAVQKYGGIPPYPETRNYVKSVEAIMGNVVGSGGGANDVGASAPGVGTQGSATNKTMLVLVAVVAAVFLITD